MPTFLQSLVPTSIFEMFKGDDFPTITEYDAQTI